MKTNSIFETNIKGKLRWKETEAGETESAILIGVLKGSCVEGYSERGLLESNK